MSHDSKNKTFFLKQPLRIIFLFSLRDQKSDFQFVSTLLNIIEPYIYLIYLLQSNLELTDGCWVNPLWRISKPSMHFIKVAKLIWFSTVFEFEFSPLISSLWVFESFFESLTSYDDFLALWSEDPSVVPSECLFLRTFLYPCFQVKFLKCL